MNLHDYIFLKKVLQERLISSNSESEDAHTAILLSEIEGEIVSRTITGHCKICKNQFNELDARLSSSRPDGICVACFTSNA